MIKKVTLIITILSYLNCFSQFDKDFSTEYESFQFISKTAYNSKLSNYLAGYLGKNELRSIEYTKTETAFKNTIRLTFTITSKGNPGNFRIRTGNKLLDKRIKTIFKNFPLEDLDIDRKNRLGRYSVQLFSKQKGKNIINASTVAVNDVPPILEGCQNFQTLSSLNSCFYKKLNEYIVQNMSSEVFKKYRLKKPKKINIYPLFTLDLEGEIYNVDEEDFEFEHYKNRRNYISPPKRIQNELNRVLKSFDQIVKPATRNGEPMFYNYDSFYVLTIEKRKTE